MKQFCILLTFLVITSNCLANTISKSNTELAITLHSALQKKQILSNQEYKNDVQMGYAGADISNRPTINQHPTFV